MGDSKSDKYNQAVARATGNNAEAIQTAHPIAGGAAALVSKVSEADIAGFMSSGEYEFAPQVFSLEEAGQMIAGILEGNGPDAELTDPQTGIVKEIKTWIIASSDGGARLSILSSSQLDRKLPPFVGDFVKIIRGKDIKTASGRRVTDYLVMGPKLKDGARRTWAQKPVIEVAEHHQLAEGGTGNHAKQDLA